jgi:uncharacterized protein YndB with AHSA1/START domain
VDCPVDEAFRLFTEGFSEWWPLGAQCTLEPWRDGKLIERTAEGKEEEWGSIIAWEPPKRLEFTWCPGRPEDRHETVQVDFEVEADGTRVTLIHQGWDRGAEPLCGIRPPEWSTVLKCFAKAPQQQLVAR